MLSTLPCSAFLYLQFLARCHPYILVFTLVHCIVEKMICPMCLSFRGSTAVVSYSQSEFFYNQRMKIQGALTLESTNGGQFGTPTPSPPNDHSSTELDHSDTNVSTLAGPDTGNEHFYDAKET